MRAKAIIRVEQRPDLCCLGACLASVLGIDDPEDQWTIGSGFRPDDDDEWMAGLQLYLSSRGNLSAVIAYGSIEQLLQCAREIPTRHRLIGIAETTGDDHAVVLNRSLDMIWNPNEGGDDPEFIKGIIVIVEPRRVGR